VAEVTFENIGKKYPGGVWAARGIDLRVADAEFVVLVGPSGCGKSTSLRMVAGLEDITVGTLRIGQRVVNQTPPKDRDVAMVFQNYALYPHMTVYKNMAFGLKLRKFPKHKIEERVRWAAGILGLEELLDRKPKALSGGQRQRVAVGRAIVRQPAAFLFDEPLSNLDAKLRVETRAELKQLHQRLNTTTLYVTHDQEEAMTLGDRVVVMDQGEIQQCDTPLEVYHAPRNRFVAGFLGMPSMNFVAGRLHRSEGQIRFEAQDVKLDLLPEQARHLSDQLDTELVLGIRPEALHLHPPASDSGKGIEVAVRMVEQLGSTMDVYATTAQNVPFVARMAAERSVQPRAALKLYVDRTRMHLFAPGEHGANLTRTSAPLATE